MNESRALLARLVSHVVQPERAEEIACQLIKKHGSLAPVLECDPRDLDCAKPLPAQAAELIALMPALARYVHRERALKSRFVGSFASASELLCSMYIGEHYECFYLLSMDARGRLIDVTLMQQGTVDQTSFYLRNVLETAARLKAHALVLSHNHPSGTPSPSHADIVHTLEAIETLGEMGYPVIDHILIADGLALSFRKLGSIASEYFVAQAMDDPLMRDWLAEESPRLREEPDGK